MARAIVSGQLAFLQLDFFESGNRKVGVQWSDLQLSAFVNNLVLPWSMADGSSVADSSIGAGAVYFGEVVGASGYYSARFFADRPGFWRLVFKHSTLGEQVVELDIVPPTMPALGMTARVAP